MSLLNQVTHDHWGSWYMELPHKDFGFSGRAAYALGYDRPNYPVPANVYDGCMWPHCTLVKPNNCCRWLLSFQLNSLDDDVI